MANPKFIVRVLGDREVSGSLYLGPLLRGVLKEFIHSADPKNPDDVSLRASGSLYLADYTDNDARSTARTVVQNLVPADVTILLFGRNGTVGKAGAPAQTDAAIDFITRMAPLIQSKTKGKLYILSTNVERPDIANLTPDGQKELADLQRMKATLRQVFSGGLFYDVPGSDDDEQVRSLYPEFIQRIANDSKGVAVFAAKPATPGTTSTPPAPATPPPATPPSPPAPPQPPAPETPPGPVTPATPIEVDDKKLASAGGGGGSAVLLAIGLGALALWAFQKE